MRHGGGGAHKAPLLDRVERLSAWKFIALLFWTILLAMIVMGSIMTLAGKA